MSLPGRIPRAIFETPIDLADVDLAEHPNRVICADNAEILPRFPDQSFQLIYIDPPFNSGKVR